MQNSLTVLLYRPVDLDSAAGQFWNELLETWEQLEPGPADTPIHADPDQLYEVWDTIKTYTSMCPTMWWDSMLV